MRYAQHDTLIRRAVEEVWNSGRLEVADELFAPDYVNHAGLITDLVRGPEAIKISVVLYRRAFPDLCITVEDLEADGDFAVLRWNARNAQPADPAGADPAGGRAGLDGVTRVRVTAGQIVESWTAWDQVAAFRRLGLVRFDGPPA